MLIEFSLVALEDIKPWSAPQPAAQAWFGLSEGQYCLRVGDQTLFEYSEALQNLGVASHCEYAVARLHEDLLQMLPAILEPVPPVLHAYIGGRGRQSWQEAVGWWCNLHGALLQEERFASLVAAASKWIHRRELDCSYLSPGASICIWSDAEQVHIEWDNRTQLFNGLPAWTAGHGQYVLSRADFVAELRSFHEALLQHMADRLHQLADQWPAAGHLDREPLQAEQQERSVRLQRALQCAEASDWTSIVRTVDGMMSTWKAWLPVMA